MPDSKYQHIIDIIYQTQNAQMTKKQIEDIFATLDKGEKQTTKSTRKMNDFEKALRRAAIVAPVWLVLRNTLMSFLQGFSAGFQYMEEFDRAMIKAQAVTHGAIGSMTDVMKDLEGRIRNLSQATGESMTKIANAFYQFGTIGFEFEEAWRGAEASVRFATATQEDSQKVAKTLAQTFKILGNTVDKTIPPHQAMEVELAKLFKLWQVNAGEAGDLTESLKAFLPTANTMNLTMDETIALLSTLNSAALLGSRGGNLLRTSFAKLLDNTDKLASSLGIYVNPELETSFTLFMKVLEAVKQLSEQQMLPLGAQEKISEIFGGIRGGEPVRALLALYDQLQSNLKLTTASFKDQGKTLDDYNKRIDTVINSVGNQLRIFRELRTQLFEQFITGALGAEDFAKGMIRANMIMEQLTIIALKAGEAINALGTSFSIVQVPPILLLQAGLDKQRAEIKERIQKAFSKELDIKQTIELSTELFTNFRGDKEFQKAAEDLKKLAIDRSRELGIAQSFQARINKLFDEYLKKHPELTGEMEKQNDVNSNTLRKLELQNKELNNQLALIKLQAEGYSDADIAVAEIALEVSKIADEFNSLDAVVQGTVSGLDKQKLLSQVLAENWDNVLNELQGYPPIQEKIYDLAKKVNSVEIEKQKIISKQKDQFTNLYLQYQKADALERGRIRRLIELQNLDTTSLKKQFETNLFDQNLILDFWNSFDQEAQNAIGDVIRRMNNLPIAQVQAVISGQSALGRLRGAGAFKSVDQQIAPSTPVAQITNVGAQNVEVNVNVDKTTPEEMADLVSKQIKSGLLTDEEFQKAFGRRISNKV